MNNQLLSNRKGIAISISLAIIVCISPVTSVYLANLKLLNNAWGIAGCPDLISPENNAVISKQPNFKWNTYKDRDDFARAAGYLIVARDIDFKEIIVFIQWPFYGPNSKDFNDPDYVGLFKDGKYYWKVLYEGYKDSCVGTFYIRNAAEKTLYDISEWPNPSIPGKVSEKLVRVDADYWTWSLDWTDSYWVDTRIPAVKYDRGTYGSTKLSEYMTENAKSSVIKKVDKYILDLNSYSYPPINITGSDPSQITIKLRMGGYVYELCPIGGDDKIPKKDGRYNYCYLGSVSPGFGTNFKNMSHTNTTLVDSSKPHVTSLTLDLAVNKIDADSTYGASGSILDIDSNLPIAGKKITIKTDASLPVKSSTNKNGNFTVQLTAPSEIGEHKIQAHFEGDEQYNPSDSPVRKITVTQSSQDPTENTDDSQADDDQSDNSQQDQADDGTIEDDSSNDDE